MSESFHGDAPPPTQRDGAIQPAEGRPNPHASLPPHFEEEASRPKLTWRRVLRSRWIRSAAFLLAVTLGIIVVTVTSDPSPGLLITAFLGIGGSLALALFGFAELARKGSRQRTAPAQAAGVAPDLAHRWGRTIFQAAAILTVGSAMASVVWGMIRYGPWKGILVGLATALILLVIIGFLAFMLYAIVMGPRVAYYRILGFFGRGPRPLPREEGAPRVLAPETTSRLDPAREQSIQPAAPTDIQPGDLSP